MYECRSEIKNLRWSSTQQREKLVELPNWGCGLRGAPASCRAAAATGGRRRRGLGESGGRLRGQGALAPTRLRAVACRAPAGVAAAGRWDLGSDERCCSGAAPDGTGQPGPQPHRAAGEPPAAQTTLHRCSACRVGAAGWSCRAEDRRGPGRRGEGARVAAGAAPRCGQVVHGRRTSGRGGQSGLQLEA